MRTSSIFLTVDCVIFRTKDINSEVLLIKRKNEPFKNLWALPGGFVDENEDLETAAKRELKEETSIEIENLHQLKAFGTPFRDPRSHVVSVAFVGFVDEKVNAIAADDALETQWFLTSDLPGLAFDHDQIIAFALSKI